MDEATRKHLLTPRQALISTTRRGGGEQGPSKPVVRVGVWLDTSGHLDPRRP